MEARIRLCWFVAMALYACHGSSRNHWLATDYQTDLEGRPDVPAQEGSELISGDFLQADQSEPHPDTSEGTGTEFAETSLQDCVASSDNTDLSLEDGPAHHDKGPSWDGLLPANPIFRVERLTITSPGLCLTLDGQSCVVDQAMVNAYIGAAIKDTEDPLNLLLKFEPFVLEGEGILLVGGGPCQFTGELPVACTFSPVEPPAKLAFSFKQGGCGPSGLPCFEATAEKIELWFFGEFLAMHKVAVSGLVEPSVDRVRIINGVISGFVPVTTTKYFQIVFPGIPSFTLYDLVKANPIYDVDGVKAFAFEFNFIAEALENLE